MDPSGSMDQEVELALELIDGGQIEMGIRALEQRVGVQPDDVRALYALGDAFARVGRQEDAARCYGRVCAIIPDAMDALDAYAATLGELGRIDEALAVTERMAELPGLEATAALRAGLVYARAGRLDEALARFTAAYQLEFGRPRRRTISFEHGRLLAGAGRPTEALALFERAARDSAEVESAQQAEEMERLRAECTELGRRS